MKDWYVKEMLGVIIEKPYVTMKEMLEKLASGGPCATNKNVARLFWGQQMFKKTNRRMDGTRRAKVKNKLELLPLGMAHGPEEEPKPRGEEDQWRRDIRCWAPALDRMDPFPWEPPKMGGRLTRYPEEIDSEECFTTEKESTQAESEDDNSDMDMT